MIGLLRAGLEGLAALPKLIEAVERIGDKLNAKEVQERLGDKRKRNADAIARVLEPPAGHGGGADSSPAVPGGDDSGAGVGSPGPGPDSGT